MARRELLELALWFHDAIYDTRAPDNEAKSAEWARQALGALSPGDLDSIERLILVTQHSGAPSAPDEELLVDIDLSILGASEQRFDEYERQIRHEYQWVPEDVYKRERAKILKHFARLPSLYHTDYFRDLLESQARENLARSLGALAV